MGFAGNVDEAEDKIDREKREQLFASGPDFGGPMEIELLDADPTPASQKDTDELAERLWLWRR